jgi:V8-like Glu-specific endopeptidase
LADANAATEAQAAYPQDWAMLEESALAESPAAADGTPGVYTSYIVNQNAALWKTNGHIPTGRLSFTTPNGTSYCSASVISGNNVIVTAAHCVYDSTNNRWYNNWAFTPAYRNGAAPYGTFPYQTCWVLTSWINLVGNYAINTWADDDVAVCKMRNNSAGQTLSSRTGWYGRMWNYGYIHHVHNMGYPFRNFNNVNVANAGQYLRLCANETFQQANNVLGGGCNWGPGISGGPWLVSYDPFDQITSYVNVVNSGLFVGQQNLYGGRFTSNNIVPLCTAAGC